eukprot:1031822-Rhodomonas_salina.1
MDGLGRLTDSTTKGFGSLLQTLKNSEGWISDEDSDSPTQPIAGPIAVPPPAVPVQPPSFTQTVTGPPPVHPPVVPVQPPTTPTQPVAGPIAVPPPSVPVPPAPGQETMPPISAGPEEGPTGGAAAAVNASSVS